MLASITDHACKLLLRQTLFVAEPPNTTTKYFSLIDSHRPSIYETLEEAISSYFSYKDYIDELVSNDCSKE